VKSADVYQVREEDDTVLKNVSKLRPWYIDPLSAVLWKVRGDFCGGEGGFLWRGGVLPVVVQPEKRVVFL
jgi:hypothetical protein